MRLARPGERGGARTTSSQGKIAEEMGFDHGMGKVLEADLLRQIAPQVFNLPLIGNNT